MDRFQFSLLGLSAEEERMRLVSSPTSQATFSLRALYKNAQRDWKGPETPAQDDRTHIRPAITTIGVRAASCVPPRTALGRFIAYAASLMPACDHLTSQM